MSGSAHDSNSMTKILGNVSVNQIFVREADFDYSPFLTWILPTTAISGVSAVTNAPAFTNVDLSVRHSGQSIEISGGIGISTASASQPTITIGSTGCWLPVASFVNTLAGTTSAGQMKIAPKLHIPLAPGTGQILGYGNAYVIYGVATDAISINTAVAGLNLATDSSGSSATAITTGLVPTPCRLRFDGTNTFQIQVFISGALSGGHQLYGQAGVTWALSTSGIPATKILITSLRYQGMPLAVADSI